MTFAETTVQVQEQKPVQKICLNELRTQPWREHWQPGPRGDGSDKLRGFSKGMEIVLGGTTGDDGTTDRILYDSRTET